MQSFDIDLPKHVLHFALPQEVVHGMPPDKLKMRFDSDESSLKKNSFWTIIHWLHDIKGPVWVGAYGSLDFSFSVQRVHTEAKMAAGTEEQLEKYIRWWVPSQKGFVIEQSVFNGLKCVRRSRNTFGQTIASPQNIEEREIFSVPLDDDTFLDICFAVIQWNPRESENWKKKAETLREAIKQTVFLEEKK